MDALEAILSRRSIRKFTGEPLPAGALRTLLEAAMAAPSAGNEQPWQFVVITEKDGLARLAAAHPYARMTATAAAAVVVCGDARLVTHGEFWVQDCAAAVENILVAARALGLGAVWCGVHPREDRVAALRDVLGLPAAVTPLALVPVGIPAENKGPAGRYDESRVHYESW